MLLALEAHHRKSLASAGAFDSNGFTGLPLGDASWVDDVEARVRSAKGASASVTPKSARKPMLSCMLSQFPPVASARAGPETDAFRREARPGSYFTAKSVPCISIVDILCRTKNAVA